MTFSYSVLTPASLGRELHHDRIQISSAGTGITANQFEIFGSEDDRLDDSEDLCRTHLSAVDARTIGPTEADLDLKSRRRLPMQNFRLDDGSLAPCLIRAASEETRCEESVAR